MWKAYYPLSFPISNTPLAGWSWCPRPLHSNSSHNVQREQKIAWQPCRFRLCVVGDCRVLLHWSMDNSEFMFFWKHALLKVSLTNQEAIKVLNCVVWKVWSWSSLIEWRLYNRNKQNAPGLYSTIILQFTVQSLKKLCVGIYKWRRQ